MDETLKQKLIEFVTEGGSSDEMEIVEEGDWEVDYKSQYLQTIVKYQDKFYAVNQSRQGSYHTDYHYDDPEVCEVEPRETVITVWDSV